MEDQVSRQIDRDLHTAEQTASWETKILLLGAGGSGKSTVMRQFKMLYTNGFKEAERLRIRKEIRKNIVQGLQLLVQATRDHTTQTANIAIVNHKHIDTLYAWDPTTAQKISSSLTLPERDANASTIATATVSNPATTTTTAPPTIVESTLWSVDMTVACVELLNDPAILSAIEMSSKLQLEDSLRYFKDHISRVGAPEYMPSDTDIAHVRIRTKGVHPLRFQIGPANFLCVDVGGQRNERRKWISQFDNVDAVLFVASIAAFDMTLIEETSKNRACEAIELFEELSHSPYFRSTDLILFLNKKDLLEDKLNKGTRVADFFSDYTGDNSYDDVVEYFIGMYKQAFARGQNVLLGGGMETLIHSDSKRLDGLPGRFSALEQKHQERQGANGNDGGGDGDGVVRRTLGGGSMWSSAPRLGGIGLNRNERESVKNKQLYVHVTHATDQENVEFTFQSCQDIILRSNLNAMML